MQLGIKKEVNLETKKYYESFYDILRTPDFDDKTRLLKPEHKIKKLGTSFKKKCRFCGKDEEEVHFKKLAHAFPESIGNSVLATSYECDTCNQYFGNTIENEYANFFSLYHSMLQVDGKRGVPNCKYRVPCTSRTEKCAEYCIEVGFDNKMPLLCKCKEVSEEYIDMNLSNKSITVSKPVGKCCPIAVFKALVKMAITVMPSEELSLFNNTIRWILESEHANFYSDNKLLVRYQMIPGFNVTKFPHYVLYRRKRTVWSKPYMLFNLTYGCFSLFIEIPHNVNQTYNLEFEKMPFPPIPFRISTTGTWNLSDVKVPNGMKHSITLTAESITDCTKDVEIVIEKEKRKINLS